MLIHCKRRSGKGEMSVDKMADRRQTDVTRQGSPTASRITGAIGIKPPVEQIFRTAGWR